MVPELRFQAQMPVALLTILRLLFSPQHPGALPANTKVLCCQPTGAGELLFERWVLITMRKPRSFIPQLRNVDYLHFRDCVVVAEGRYSL